MSSHPAVIQTTIIIDTREQRPYSFEGTDKHLVQTVRKALPAGDYSVLGGEGRFAVERKSMADYLRTVVHESTRFREELRKLLDYDRAYIVVEHGWERMVRGDYERAEAIRPEAVIGLTMGLLATYGVPVLWAGDRPAARLLVERLCCAWALKNGCAHAPGASAQCAGRA